VHLTLCCINARQWLLALAAIRPCTVVWCATKSSGRAACISLAGAALNIEHMHPTDATNCQWTQLQAAVLLDSLRCWLLWKCLQPPAAV
jgi:hypothetical protein